VFVVLYNQPKDTAAFEKYYAETHVPLFKSHAQEIGVTRVELVRFFASGGRQAGAHLPGGRSPVGLPGGS